MRLRSVAAFALIGLVAFSPLARAEDASAARAFGNFNCRQRFECSTAARQNLAAMANACFQQGFGRPANPQSTMPDSNGCISGTLGDNGKNSSQSKCCVIKNADSTCGMSCAFMMR